MLRYPHTDSREPLPPLGAADAAKRPARSASSGPAGSDTDAFTEWMAHVDAGRIAVC